MKFTMQRLLGAQGSRRLQGLCLTLALGTMSSVCHAQAVVNGDFAIPQVSGFQFPTAVQGWTTTDEKKQFEIWKSGTKDPVTERIYEGPNGIQQFAEVAANSHSTLTQVVTGIQKGNKYGFSFWHRGRHKGDTEADTIVVSVMENSIIVWTETFSTTAKEWVPYTVPVGIKKGDGPVTLSFQSKETALKSKGAGNFLTGIKLGANVVPPTCVQNASGKYSWNSTDRPGETKPRAVGTVILNDDNSSSYWTGNPEKENFRGVWQVSADCRLDINWNKGMTLDTLTVSPDGKQVKGLNQNKLVLRGDKK